MAHMPIAPETSARFGRYLVAGGLAATVNYGSRFILSEWLPFEAAVLVAFAIGLTTGFVLMRSFAFRADDGKLLSQVIAYCAVNLLAVVQTVAISSALLRFLLPAMGVQNYQEAIAHGFGVAAPVVTSYFGHRRFTFK